MALVVQLVVGQLEFVKANDLSHPRLTRSRRVRVDVHTWGYGWIRISCHHPLGTVVHISLKYKKREREREKNMPVRINPTQTTDLCSTFEESCAFVWATFVAWPSDPKGYTPKRAAQKGSQCHHTICTDQWSVCLSKCLYVHHFSALIYVLSFVSTGRQYNMI